jgi:pulcherriminic acid synthase
MSIDTASGSAATDEGSSYSEEETEAAEPLPASGYRTYEVYQRERTGETTNLLKPRQLISRDFADDPYPLLGILRENYPCYRDWAGNRFWITRYDDVTSLISDEANFETRSKRWFYGRPDLGRDLNGHLPVEWARANAIDAHVEPVTAAIIDRLRDGGDGDLATEFAASLPLELWGRALSLPEDDLASFSARYWRMQRGWLWDPVAQKDGLAAIDELITYIEPLLAARRADPGDDMISAMAGLDLPDGPVTAADVVTTILEPDHETLHGALANLWFLLLTHPEQFAVVRDEPRMMKFAYLETLRHSTPVLSAMRFARREVERFGRLLPGGALAYCSAAAANRDPRAFADPDTFIVGRKDLCQREPRGQFRADGLPAGVAPGFGKPTIHPAVPKERPRSMYAVTRDTATTASRMLLDAFPSIASAEGTEPRLRSLRIGEMHTCWSLPVRVS